MIIGNNWLNIDRLHDGTYRVVTKLGTELAAKLTREDADAACCALCIHYPDPGYRDESPVWMSLLDSHYKATRPSYTPEWHEIRIGTIADIRKWYKRLHKKSRLNGGS